MRKIVLDTNVFLDCWVFDDPGTRRLKECVEEGRCLAARSAATDAELADVLARPQFHLDGAARDALLATWQQRAALIDVKGMAPVSCADPDDQKFLDLAVAADATALFTKDKALLAVAASARRLGFEVVAPTAANSVLLLEDDVA